jgi:hypothetical protein
MKVKDLLAVRGGELLIFDYPVDRVIKPLINGAHKFTGRVVSIGRRRACLVEQVSPVAGQGKMSGEPERSDNPGN